MLYTMQCYIAPRQSGTRLYVMCCWMCNWQHYIIIFGKGLWPSYRHVIWTNNKPVYCCIDITISSLINDIQVYLLSEEWLVRFLTHLKNHVLQISPCIHDGISPSEKPYLTRAFNGCLRLQGYFNGIWSDSKCYQPWKISCKLIMCRSHCL